MRDLDAHASVYRVLVGVACAFEMFVVRLAVSRARANRRRRCEIAKNMGPCGEKIGDDNQRLRRDSYYDFARAMAM
jgi:hypothetical protein